jgi:hypothetical protein
MNPSSKKDSVGAPQLSAMMASQPTSALAKKRLHPLMPLSLPGFGSLASWIYCRSCLLAL